MEKAIYSFITVPAVAAIFLPFAAKLKPRLAETVSVLTLLAGIFNLSMLLFSFYTADSSQIPSDCLIIFLTGIIYLFALCFAMYSSAELETGRNGREYFFSLLLISVSLFCGAAAAENFFTLYLCIESLCLSSAVMIAISRNGTAGITAASDWLFLTAPSSFLCICGLSLLFLFLGSLSFDSLQQISLSGDPFGPILFAASLLILGFVLKAAIFFMPQERSKDFRTDLPVAGHLALNIARLGIMYAVFRAALLLRFSYGNAQGLSLFLMILGAAVMAAGAVASFQAHDLKKMACFTNFSSSGLFLVMTGASTPLAVISALLIILSNSFETMLMLICGGITERKKTRLMSLFSSQGAVLALFGGLSQSGMPPFAGFWVRLLAAIALFDADRPVLACIVIFSEIFILSAMLKQRRKLFSDNKHIQNSEDSSSPKGEPVDRKKEFLLDPLGGNGEKWLRLFPAWVSAAMLVVSGIMFPFIYLYLHITAGRLFL